VRSVRYSSGAFKSIAGLNEDGRLKIETAIGEIVVNPLIGKKLRGKFEREGIRSHRVWPFRIVYSFTSDELAVKAVSHRKDVYR